MVLSEVLITFVITSTIGCSIALLKVFYKFKFSKVAFCNNCLTIERDTQVEENIEEMKINKINSLPRINSLPISETATNKTDSLPRIDSIHRKDSVITNKTNSMNMNSLNV